ncbi:MAG: hypothetical protein RLZZ628_2020 [Bacteroidota bacterium]|jgi:hypothetical protein
MTSVLNKNQLPWLGYVSGSFKAVCIITSTNLPLIASASFSYALTDGVTAQQELLPDAPLVWRNGILQTWMVATVKDAVVTIAFTRYVAPIIYTSGVLPVTTTKTDSNFANWAIGDEIVVEVRYYLK